MFRPTRPEQVRQLLRIPSTRSPRRSYLACKSGVSPRWSSSAFAPGDEECRTARCLCVNRRGFASEMALAGSVIIRNIPSLDFRYRMNCQPVESLYRDLRQGGIPDGIQ